jgi:predicted O-methyltransferase YrrM
MKKIFNEVYEKLRVNCKKLKKHPHTIIVQDKKEIIGFMAHVVDSMEEGQKDFRFLEIGSRLGGSFAFFGNCMTALGYNVYGVSVDMPGAQGEGEYDFDLAHALKVLECNFKYDLVSGDSHELKTFEQVESFLNYMQVDMVFIDGDHTEFGCLRDFLDYWELCRPGGLVAMHDIVEPKHWPWVEVHKIWPKIKELMGYEAEIKYYTNPPQYGIGIVRKWS